MNGKILVAGIGNIFFGDDAFGVQIAKRLTDTPLPQGVVVRDFGIRSYDLAYALMKNWDLVILVDALPVGGKPGTLYAFEPELPAEGGIPPSLDAHTLNPESVLQLVQALGGKTGRLLVVGCEPESVEPNQRGEIGLSPHVRAAMDEAVRMIQDLVARASSQAMAA